MLVQCLDFGADETVEGVVVAIAGVSGEVADDVGGRGPK